MAHGFDELVNFLLDEVALRFAEGASLDDFKDAVARFYADWNAEKDAKHSNIDARLLNAIDHSLLEKAWAWLLVHSDIWVGKPSSQDDSTPDILVAGDQDASVLSLSDAESVDLASDDESARIRLWTSHERVWQTVAGHGVDFKRVPGEEFRLLCMIAGAGEKGIAQPDLVKWSKQDKKSVPGRTDNLHKGGYIRKTRILAEKHNTSLLVHRRFIPEEELDALDRPVFINGSLSFDNLLNVLKEKLKNGIAIKMNDLEEFLGCSIKSWEKRALWRALERLDIIGVVQRFRMDETRPGKKGNLCVFKTKHIKLLRDPTEADFKRYTSLTVKDRNDFRKRLEAQDAETQGEHAEYMEDDDYAPAAAAATDSTNQDTAADMSLVWKMQWDSDVAWTNTVYNAVQAAGVRGLSSMAARDATYGRFYDRPVEQMLGRLTDVWQKAQPDHLKHFNIIRDTDTRGRSTNYLYRTHDAFQQAVDEGSTVWENTTNGKNYETVAPQLDQFGFSIIDKSQFLKNGTATLAEGIADTNFEVERVQKTDPILGKNADGSLKVVWSHDQASKKPRKTKVNQVATEDPEDGLPVTPKGRGGPRVKGTGSASKKTVESSSSTESVPAALQTEHGLRIRAEKLAFDEAQKQQKDAPVNSATGTHISSTWQPGRGRARMILVDDSILTENVNLPGPTASNKRSPVVVLESKVRAILETIRAADETAKAAAPTEEAATPIAGASTRERRRVTLKAPRLNELHWFKDPSTLQSTAADATALPETVSASVPSVSPSQEKRLDSARADSPTRQAKPGESASVHPPTTPSRQSSSTHEQQKSDWLGQLEEAAEQDGDPKNGSEVEALGTPGRKDWAQRQSTYIRPPPPSGASRKKRGTVVGRGTAQYKRILLIEQIMEKSGGIFPGDSEMVPAFQKLQKTELKSETTSDRDTVMKAVKALVDGGKLIRFSFFFKDRNGKQVQKWVIHRPHILVSSPEVKDLMKKIEEAHPRNYVPPPYGDGETGRGEQRKNIDRFQYRPGKSIVQPSGTEFVIDVEAKRRELEAQRLAAAAAIRAEEMKRLKAQAARNKKRQATIARKPRRNRASLRKTAQPDPWLLDHMGDDDDPDRVMPSVEVDGIPITKRYDRPRYRDIRPAPHVSELDIAKLDSGVQLDYGQTRRAPHLPLMLPGGQVLSPPTRRTSKGQLLPKSAQSISGSRRSLVDKLRAQPTLVFREPQGPRTYDPLYDAQDIPTLLYPTQRFHPSTGTFSTDFFIRTNVRHSHWLEPRNFAFENHTTTNPDDVEWYNNTGDYDNFFHPNKKPRKYAPGLLSKKAQEVEPEYDSDVEFEDTWFEKKELQTMREEFPDLIHDQPQDGFVSFSFGGMQETAEDMYQYGIRPMEHIVLHGADPEDFQGVEFEDHNRRPTMPNEMDIDSDGAEHVPSPRAIRAPRRTKRARKATLDQAADDYALPAPPTPARSADTRTGTQSGKCHISSAQSRRLFFACIAVRVLCGELEGTINWGTIRETFADHPDFDLPTFKARWNRMYHNYSEVVAHVQLEFQDAFVVAYDKGLIPPLDVMHGSRLYYKKASNWNLLVDWALETIAVFPDEVGLPPTRDALDAAFRFKVAPSEVQDKREKMEHVYTTHAKREEIAHTTSFAVPFIRKKRPVISNVDFIKSWIRANCATSDENYDADAANAKFKKPDQGLLTALTKEMHAEKIIAHSFKMRNKVARNYHLSDQYNQVFGKRPLDAGNFAEAVAFKASLDKVFASGDPRLMLDYNVSDGVVMAITEMLAAGRVSVKAVLPPVDSTIGAPWPRLTVWGFTEGQYKLRNMDRKTFTWKLEVVPTSNYVTGHPAKMKAEQTKPPMTSKQDKAGSERIPLWYGIHGNFIPKYWEALLRSVVQHMAMKAGSTISTLTGPYRGLVWEWEMQMLVDWLVEVGVADVSKDGAVRAKEWWWTVVPNQAWDVETNSGADEKYTEPAAPAPKKRRVRGGKAKNVER